MAKPLLCVVGFHRWVRVGRPGAADSYSECGRCRKLQVLKGMGAAHDFYRSGMDEKSQDNRWFGEL
jgi:hypothetical protein